MSMSKGLKTVLLFGIIGAVAIVLGILMQSLRDSQTAGQASFVIADSAVNATVNTATQLETVGTLIGIFILVGVAVLMVLLLISLVKKFGGGSGGRGKRYYMYK